MKKIIYVFVIAILFLSCTTTTKTLQIAPFEIRSDNDPFGISVDEKGIIQFQNEIIGSIKADGSFRDNNNDVVAILTKDNILKNDSSKTKLTITKNGQIINAAGNMKGWTENGEFVNGKEKSGFTIVPVDKKLFQIASVVMVLFFGLE